ncbi:MAG: hypothetical protein WEB58_18475 [Planctomycetaceae bacterium]
MQILKAFLRTYWINTIAFGLFLIPVVRYVAAARWLDLLPLPVLAFIGLIFFIANELVSETMPEVSHFRFEGFQLFQSPFFVKIAGTAMLLTAAVATLML